MSLAKLSFDSFGDVPINNGNNKIGSINLTKSNDSIMSFENGIAKIERKKIDANRNIEGFIV